MQDASKNDSYALFFHTLKDMHSASYVITNKYILKIHPARQQKICLHIFREECQTSGFFPWAFLDYFDLIHFAFTKLMSYGI